MGDYAPITSDQMQIIETVVKYFDDFMNTLVSAEKNLEAFMNYYRKIYPQIEDIIDDNTYSTMPLIKSGYEYFMESMWQKYDIIRKEIE